jgi:hypothetical protein
MPAQPSDEWTYLRPEEFADDDAVERVGAQMEVGAEDDALHLIDGDEPRPTEALDPGRTLERPRVDDGPTATYFDDEEPEGRRDGATASDDANEEPRVDEILVSQHYAFDPEPGDSSN